MKKLIASIACIGALAGSLVAADQNVTVKCVAGLKFDTTEIKVKAGDKLILKLVNPDVMPHNLAIVKPGSEQKVATAIMGQMPAAMAVGFVAKGDDVIAATKMLDKGGQEDTIEHTFTEAGSYPYICTFPGHSAIMKGTIIVE